LKIGDCGLAIDGLAIDGLAIDGLAIDGSIVNQFAIQSSINNPQSVNRQSPLGNRQSA
jgi:hypothetical protein